MGTCSAIRKLSRFQFRIARDYLTRNVSFWLRCFKDAQHHIPDFAALLLSTDWASR